MLSCKEASRLMSAAQDRKLSVQERLGLRLHLLVCAGCTNYQRQMDFLRRALRRHATGAAASQDRDAP